MSKISEMGDKMFGSYLSQREKLNSLPEDDSLIATHREVLEVMTELLIRFNELGQIEKNETSLKNDSLISKMKEIQLYYERLLNRYDESSPSTIDIETYKICLKNCPIETDLIRQMRNLEKTRSREGLTIVNVIHLITDNMDVFVHHSGKACVKEMITDLEYVQKIAKKYNQVERITNDEFRIIPRTKEDMPIVEKEEFFEKCYGILHNLTEIERAYNGDLKTHATKCIENIRNLLSFYKLPPRFLQTGTSSTEVDRAMSEFVLIDEEKSRSDLSRHSIFTRPSGDVNEPQAEPENIKGKPER